MTFKVGMKVVCVDARDLRGSPHWSIKLGEVYTVAGIVHVDAPDPHYAAFGTKLYVDGGRREPCKCCGKEIPYSASRFRPLEEKPDAIEVFRAICLGGDIRPGGDGLDVRVPSEIEAAGCGGIK